MPASIDPTISNYNEAALIKDRLHLDGTTTYFACLIIFERYGANLARSCHKNESSVFAQELGGYNLRDARRRRA